MDRSYGFVAAFCGVLLLWFALWTIAVNGLVLSGTRYELLVWSLPVVTLATMAVAVPWVPRVISCYARHSPAQELEGEGRRMPVAAVGLACAALVSAFLINRYHSVSLVLVLMAGLSFGAWRLAPASLPISTGRSDRAALPIALVFLLVCGLYYFGNWPDWDDANYINLAVGAQHSKGLVFQYDTMLGDGPGSIHLPTYKFHSFELLGAVLSTVTGLEPLATLHLLMPLPQLAFLAALMFLLFKPIVGRDWSVAAIFTLAFLYGVTETYGTWGVHGVLRFHQGKGFLVTVLVPLAAGLTARWFLRREKLDLFALALCHICAIGSSANGLYLTPLTSAFVASAFLVTSGRPVLRDTIGAGLWLLPTLAYPIVMAIVGKLAHLYLPSEVIGRPDAYESFRFVTGWRFGGLIALALLPLGALPVVAPRLRLAVAVYVPLALVVVLNPFGWTAALIATGNLGFRLLWAIPAAFIAGLACTGFIRHLLGHRLMPGLIIAGASLAAGIVYNARFVEEPYRATWDWPRPRVVDADYDDATKLASLVSADCAALVPERLAVWLATIPDVAHPVFVRSLYLKHYRFTMPRRELVARWRLFDLEDGSARATAPSPAELKDLNIKIGLIAFEPDASGRSALADLATKLKLEKTGHLESGLVYWRGNCSEERGELK